MLIVVLICYDGYKMRPIFMAFSSLIRNWNDLPLNHSYSRRCGYLQKSNFSALKYRYHEYIFALMSF